MKTHSVIKRNTDDFLNLEVKDYAIYVIKTRSLPSIMDGMRIGARKIVYAAMTGDLKKGKKDKMPSLIGDSMKMAYHHGDASLKNTIEQLGMKHNFRFAPLDIMGQIPSLRTPDTATAARYLEVKKNQYLSWYEMDKELLEIQVEEGKKIEPKFFLPLVPIALLWRTNSPGFGFGYRSFSHNFDSVIDAVMQSIITGSCSGLNHVQLKPEIEGINPDNMIYNQNKNTWYNVGEYTITNDSIHITDLPYTISYAKYREHLTTLKESGYITKFLDNSSGGKTNFLLFFPPGRLNTIMNAEKWKFFTNLKLFVKIPNLNLNTIDIDGKSIVNFGTANDLVDGFVKRRLNVYAQRKTRLITVIKEDIDYYEDIAKFIQLVVDDILIVNKRKTADIKIDCDKHGVSYEGLKLKIGNLTEEEITEIREKIVELKEYLHYIQTTTIQQMYIKDLIEFKEQYSEIVKYDDFVKSKNLKEKGIVLEL